MFLLNWYKEWLELKREYKSKQPCETCETLKISVEQLRVDNQRLLDRLLEKPESEVRPVVDNVTPIVPRNVPWKVRQQMLEANDRHKAKLMREAPIPASRTPIKGTAPETTTEELEEEVLAAEQERENAAK